MNNFTFYSPTKVIFGKDVENQIGAQVSAFGAKKLLVLIGSEKSVEMAVRNTRTEVRHTRFIQNLQKCFR